MKDLNTDQRIVLSLDAGGTTLHFSAMQAGQILGEEYILPAKAHTLQEFLAKLKQGFQTVKETAGRADAISFAFPGPADYPNGIIGDLENLPVFKGGIALGPWLEKEFGIPAYINNDGDLFTLGESIGGFLPLINKELHQHQNPKQYQQLIGATFGTGFGGGLVLNHQLITGANSAGGEINRMTNKLYPGRSVEESVSIRGVKRVYTREAQLNKEDCPEPFDIYKIAKGEVPGNKEAANKSFEELAIVAADAIANAISLFDAPVVIGGGLSGSHDLLLPKIVEELNSTFKTFEGKGVHRMEVFAYNWNNAECRKDFLANQSHPITIPGSDQTIDYDPVKKITVGVSQLGTSKAVALGAYAYALLKLDQA
jgi:glucokinase